MIVPELVECLSCHSTSLPFCLQYIIPLLMLVKVTRIKIFRVFKWGIIDAVMSVMQSARNVVNGKIVGAAVNIGVDIRLIILRLITIRDEERVRRYIEVVHEQ